MKKSEAAKQPPFKCDFTTEINPYCELLQFSAAKVSFL